jgi:hypothetical protein
MASNAADGGLAGGGERMEAEDSTSMRRVDHPEEAKSCSTARESLG